MLVVSIYQLGFMSSLFGVDHPGSGCCPLAVLIGILFGLAMDYQMFLVTGMREAADAAECGDHHCERLQPCGAW